MQQNTTTKQVTEEVPYIGSSGSSGRIPISLGYLAQAEEALLLMQENYTELDQLQRKTNIMELKNQQGDGGTVMAQARAIQNSADADRDKATQDMYSEVTQGIGSFVNAGIDAIGMKVKSKAGEEADTEKKKATEFETAFDEATKNKASQTVTDDAEESAETAKLKGVKRARKETLKGAKRARMEEILSCQGKVELQAGDKEILEHISANLEDRKKVSARINQVKHSADLALHGAITQRQTLLELIKGFSSALQRIPTAYLAYHKGTIDADQKGPADALRVVAQASDGTTSAAIQNGDQLAAKIEDQTAALNRIRDALASNNGTAGQ